MIFILFSLTQVLQPLWPLSFLRTQAPFTRCSSGARLRIRAAQSVCHPTPFVGQRLLSFLRCSCLSVRLVVGATSLPTTARVGALQAPGQGVSDDVPIAGLRLVLSGSLRVLASRGPDTAAAGTNPSTSSLGGCLLRQDVSDDVPIAGLRLKLPGSLRTIVILTLRQQTLLHPQVRWSVS